MFLRRCVALTLVCLAAAANAQSLLDLAQQQGSSDSLSGNGQTQRSVQLPANSGLGAVPSVPSIANDASLLLQRGLNTQSNVQNGQNLLRTPTPQPLAEFQRFVWGATGRMLPLFGQNLFADAVQTYAPVDRVPVPADYVIGPGDELLIRAWGAVDVDFRAEVDRNGMINIPHIGSFGITGIKSSEVESYLRSQIGRIYKNFDLSVTLGQLRSIQIFVVGQAVQPGSYTVSSLSTLVTALFASGGPNPNGSMRHIVLRRGDKVVTEFDLYDFLVSGDKKNDARLLPGDVIMIPAAGPRVAVLGAVRMPAIYELKSSAETLGQVLRYGGGTSVVTSATKAQLERVDPTNPQAPRQVSTVAFDAGGLASLLRDADILTAFEVRPAFSNAVTLRGNVEQALRYPYQPGMRISTLIPERSALITRDYYRRRNRLVEFLNPGEDEYKDLDSNGMMSQSGQLRGPYGASPFGRQPGVAGSLGSNMQGYAGSVTGGMQNGTVGNLTMAQGAIAGGNLSQAGGVLVNGVAAQQQQGNASALGLAGAAGGGLGQTGSSNLQANGLPMRLPLGNDGWAASSAQDATWRQRNDRLPDPDSLLDQVNWDYAVVERMDPKTLSSQLLPFNLRRAVVDRDPRDDLELQPGDVVTIFSLRDVRGPQSRQTQYVRIEGEVRSPGVYQLLPGESLRQLLERVGGLTNQAYAYGIEFTRESTRLKQQVVLQDAVRRLQAALASSSADELANASSSDVEVAKAAMAAQQQSQQAQLKRLEEIVPIGRIALELPLDAKGIADLPDLPLENGDSVMVPGRPGFVFAVGAVANENALVWRPGRTVDDYLRSAGVETAADQENTFVIRADGSVAHARNYSGLFSNGFGSLDLMPGDTIVIPQKIDRTTKLTAFLRGAKDWTQILYQFGLGAAAFHTLKN